MQSLCRFTVEDGVPAEEGGYTYNIGVCVSSERAPGSGLSLKGTLLEVTGVSQNAKSGSGERYSVGKFDHAEIKAGSE